MVNQSTIEDDKTSPVVNGSLNDQATIVVPKRKRVGLLWSSYEGSNSVFKGLDPAPFGFLDHNPNVEEYEFEVVGLPKATAIQNLQHMIQENKFDIYYNMCDGAETDTTAGVEVAEFLYRQNVPLISPSPQFFLTSKFRMKFLAKGCSISTPEYCFFYGGTRAQDFQRNFNAIRKSLQYPMIVKQHNGAGSEGLTEASKVYNDDELESQIVAMCKKFGGALVEEFIKGREFTVLVAENCDDPNNPIVYPPVECLLDDGDSFKHFHLKFVDFGHLQWVPVVEDSVRRILMRDTAKIFLACRGNTYARCDYRMCEKTGQIYFLEINVLPGVFYPSGSYGCSDFILNSCHSHKSFVQNLINCAIKSFDIRQTVVDNVTANRFPHVGYMSCLKSVQKGRVIVDLTKLPCRVISRLEFEKFRPDEFRTFFMECSLPITNQLRLWLVNDGHLHCDFELGAIKRGPDEMANCVLDHNFQLIADRDICEGEMFILGHNYD